MQRGGGKGRLLIAAIIAVISIISYFRMSADNPVTGEKQRVGLSQEQEIALGLEAAPQMAAQHGGLDPDPRKQALMDEVGQEIVAESKAAESGYKYDFHVLDDAQTVNAFALPGGQIFITDALLSRFKTRGQLAGVLGHEIAHVVHRHAAEHIAKAQLTQGLTGAAVLATYDPGDPSTRQTAAFAAMIGQLVNLKYGRDDELESDRWGVRLMAQAGYDPNSMVDVMKVLQEAGGGGRQPEFFSSHPNPENRIEKIQQAIKEEFPNGVPAGLIK